MSAPARVSSGWRSWLLPVALGLASFAVYLRTLASTVLPGDSGEFQFAAPLMGVAHPTGYPLYILLGKLWTLLVPWGDLAQRMNLFSAFWSVLAVALVYLVARQLTGRPFAAAIAALTLAFSRTFWSQAVVAEVYALHSFFVAAILYLALRTEHRTKSIEQIEQRAKSKEQNIEHRTKSIEHSSAPSILYALCFLLFTLGLSLAHHRTTLLVLPALAVFLWMTRDEGRGTRNEGRGMRDEERGMRNEGQRNTQHATRSPFHVPRSKFHVSRLTFHVSRFTFHASRFTFHASRFTFHASRFTFHVSRFTFYVLLVTLPLLLYLLIPLRAPATPYLHLSVGNQVLDLYENSPQGFLRWVSGSVFRGELGFRAPGDLPGRLAMAFGFLRQQFGLVGILLGLAGGVVLWRRSRPRFWLLLLAYLGIVLFCLAYFIGDIGDLFTPSYVVFALWIGLGVDGLLSVVRSPQSAVQSQERPGTWDLGLRTVGYLLAILLPLALLWGNFAASDRSGETGVRAHWEAILRQPLEPGAILVSNDRDEIMPLWYLQYAENQRPDLVGLFPLIKEGPQYANIGRLLDGLLGGPQPVYLVKPMPGLEVAYRLSPAGPLVRLLGRAVTSVPAAPPGFTPADAGGQLRLLNAALSPATLSPGQSLTVTLYWQVLAAPTTDYDAFVHLLDASGQRVAQSDHRPGGVYYPSSLWQPGELLADAHTIALPATLPPGTYTLHTGLYDKPTMKRLPIPGSPDDSLELGAILVQR